MIAIGCLAPLILCVGGAVAGHFLAGTTGAMWGFGIGLAIGLALLAVQFFVLEKAKND